MFNYNENAEKEKWLLKKFEKLPYNDSVAKTKYVMYAIFNSGILVFLSYESLNMLTGSFTAADKELAYQRIKELEENYPTKKYLILADCTKNSHFIGATVRSGM